MRIVATDALILHAFDYRETSRIVRLATRDAGIVSVIARGARRPKSRFGSAFDLFTSGVAHFAMRPSADLHTLTGFDATHSRPELAGSLARFGAASAVAEICMRFGREDESGRVHDAALAMLDAIGLSAPDVVASVALAGIWRLVAELGFAPSLSECASCATPIEAAASVTFHHRAGGALCAACATRSSGGRLLPAAARAVVTRWLDGGEVELADAPSARAHRRLLREFLEEHLGDGTPLRAFISWEELRAPEPTPAGARA